MVSLFMGIGFELPTSSSRLQEALVKALARATWQAGDGLQAKVVGCSRPVTTGLTFDQLMMTATVKVCASEAETRDAFKYVLLIFFFFWLRSIYLRGLILYVFVLPCKRTNKQKSGRNAFHKNLILSKVDHTLTFSFSLSPSLSLSFNS